MGFLTRVSDAKHQVHLTIIVGTSTKSPSEKDPKRKGVINKGKQHSHSFVPPAYS